MQRKYIPKKIQLLVWKRDHWTCRYCNQPVFFNPTLKIFEEISPGHGYYHPHGKRSIRHSFIDKRTASIDHIIPLKKGGSNSIDNYVTACWDCNLKYGEKTFDEGKPKPLPINEDAAKVNWDGFSSLYLKLCKKRDEWARLLEKI
jgi:5-methylcytosine-specific restriction endonuclease McrA